ncbi:MAG: hypothetical protein IKC35_01550 [Clostridia bacterium]|nr:hypothetical protein [Clostridia bacterium]
MKKIISVVLVAIMLFALVGCNGRAMEEKLAELEAKLQEQERMLMDLTKDDNYLLTLIMELEEEKTEQLNQITVLEETVEQMKEDAAEAKEDRDNEIAALQEEINRLEQECEQKQKAIDEIMSVMVEEKVEQILVGGCDPSDNSYQCGYRYLKTCYNIDNVTLKFYFATFCSGNWSTNGSVTVLSGYVDENGKSILYDNEVEITRIEDIDAESKETKTGDYASSIDDFNYFINITIPQELFVDEKGMVCISLMSHNFISENEYTQRMVTSITIYYKKIDSYIILSAEQF